MHSCMNEAIALRPTYSPQTGSIYMASSVKCSAISLQSAMPRATRSRVANTLFPCRAYFGFRIDLHKGVHLPGSWWHVSVQKITLLKSFSCIAT